MHRALPLLLLALACSAPAPEPMPSPIALTPDTRELMIGRKWMGHREIWMDSVTKVANVYFQGEHAPFEPYGPDLYISFYFSGIWREGQVTVRDLERTLMANFDDSVLVSIDSPPNDLGGHYYVILLPSTGPRTHHRTMMRVGADGPDLFNFVLTLKLDGRWRARFLM